MFFILNIILNIVGQFIITYRSNNIPCSNSESHNILVLQFRNVFSTVASADVISSSSNKSNAKCFVLD